MIIVFRDNMQCQESGDGQVQLVAIPANLFHV